MAWKSRKYKNNTEQSSDYTYETKNGMIEVSINKHKEQTAIVVHPPSNHTPHQPAIPRMSNTWDGDKYDRYLTELTERGVVVGKRVVTTYGFEGVIHSFKPKEKYGLFFTSLIPSIIAIKMPGKPLGNLYYNENEIILLDEESNAS